MRGEGDAPTNPYGKRPLFPIPPFDYGHFAAEEGARTGVDFVRVAVVAAGVGMAGVVVGVAVCRCHGRGEDAVEGGGMRVLFVGSFVGFWWGWWGKLD